jgi:outer membrane protein insertion porin family
MRLKLLLVVTITAIAQIANSGIVSAESSQIGNLIAVGVASPVENRNLANLTLDRSKIDTTRNIPSAIDLIAQSKRKSQKPVNRRKRPLITTTPSQSPSANTPLGNTESQVTVAEIVVKTDRGQLDPALAAKIRQVLTINVGQSVTRDRLEQNLNAVRALGDFATVQIVPEGTAKGVKISFVVKPYGTLKQVQIRTLPDTSSSLTSAAIDEIFKPQYGKQLNAIELKAAIAKLNQLYQQQGYNLAQVVGKVTIVIAEGSIEDVRVRFLNKKGEAVDGNNQPYSGQTRPFIITREAELKPGKIFNRATVEKDLRRIYGLGLFDDVRVSFAPGSDPAKVVLQYDVIERNKNFSIVPNVGYGSVNGFFASLNYN